MTSKEVVCARWLNYDAHPSFNMPKRKDRNKDIRSNLGQAGEGEWWGRRVRGSGTSIF